MKKLISLVVLIFLLSLGTINVYADPLTSSVAVQKEENQSVEQKELDFAVTGGVDFDKTKEATFDESRVVTGVGEHGIIVGIKVTTKTSTGVIKESEYYELEIGPSKMFSQSIDLGLGDNSITVTAQKENCEPVEIATVINRKVKRIKAEIESGAILQEGYYYSPRALLK